MSEVFEAMPSKADAEVSAAEVPAGHAEFVQDSEPAEPRCAAGLGSIALCVTCPMARFLGGCPKGIAVEAMNTTSRVETTDDLFLDSGELDTAFPLAPVFEPSVREVVMPRTNEDVFEEQLPVSTEAARPKTAMSTVLREIEIEPEMGSPVKTASRPQAISTERMERPVATAESTPRVREVMRPLAPQETFLDALFDDSVTVISAGMVIEERYETALPAGLQAEPVRVEMPPTESIVPREADVVIQETIPTVRPLPEASTSAKTTGVEERTLELAAIDTPAFRVEPDVQDLPDTSPVEGTVYVAQSELDSPIPVDEIEPHTRDGMDDQSSPVFESVDTINESHEIVWTFTEEEPSTGDEAAFDVHPVREDSWLEDASSANEQFYSSGVLITEQEARTVFPPDPNMPAMDTPEYLHLLTAAPTATSGALPFTLLGLWAVRLLALRSPLARLA